MEAQLKDIVSHFLQKSPAEISSETVIDRSAVAGSIVIHRMYASLSEAGFAVEDYSQISSFGELQQRLDGGAGSTETLEPEVKGANTPYALGVDVQSIAELPAANDYRTEPFYQATFSPEEISYCILQANPRQSFAGLFAAKEALVKANYRLHKLPLHELSIGHEQSGKPVYGDYQLSISHSGDVAMAAALLPPPLAPLQEENEASPEIAKNIASIEHIQVQNHRLKRGLWFCAALTTIALILSSLQLLKLL